MTNGNENTETNAVGEPPQAVRRLRQLRRIVWIAVAVAVVAFTGVFGWRAYQDANPPTAGEAAKDVIRSEFELVNHRGETVTEQAYRGTWQVVFFGFTHCPDICPTTLATIAETLELLGKDAGRVSPLFVTVDPERDTPDVLTEYVKAFHPDLIGLTGTPAQVKAAAGAFRVYHSKVPQADAPDGYLMAHSGYIYLMTPKGEFDSLYTDKRDSADAIATAIRKRIEENR